MDVLSVNPFPPDVLCDTMWLILEFLDVFEKKGAVQKACFHDFECFQVFTNCLIVYEDVYSLKEILNRRTTQ